jgi:hypothetical protein
VKRVLGRGCKKERKKKKSEEVRREARAERAKKKRRTATVACFMLGGAVEANGVTRLSGVAFVLVWRAEIVPWPMGRSLSRHFRVLSLVPNN